MYCTSLRSQKQSYLGGFKRDNGYQPCGRVMATFPLSRLLFPINADLGSDERVESFAAILSKL